jgi:hypothetical protein
MSFTPGYNTVVSITQANPAVVTTGTNHNLTDGQVIRLRIPPKYGMPEVNNNLYVVSVLSNTTFSLQYKQVPFVNVDSTQFTPFVNANTGTPAQMAAVGAAPSPATAPDWAVRNGVSYTTLKGATDNTSTVEMPF